MKINVSVAGVFLEYRPLVRRFASEWSDRPFFASVVWWIRSTVLFFVGVVWYTLVVVPVDILVFLGAMVASVSLMVIAPLAIISAVVALLESVE